MNNIEKYYQYELYINNYYLSKINIITNEIPISSNKYLYSLIIKSIYER